MYDAVVVGARCAGAAIALLLSRRGYRVLLVDRGTFPSDTMSTLYIHPPGMARLNKWGLGQAVADSGCPSLPTVSYGIGDVRLEGSAAGLAPADVPMAPRRRVLDQVLIDAAIAAGAEFRERTSLRELLWDQGRVTGVRLGPASGPGIAESAHLVIGADGMRSRVARLASAPLLRSDPPLSCVYYTRWHGLDTGFGFSELPGSWVARIPTHYGETFVATYFPQEDFGRIRGGDPLAAHLAAIQATAPEIAVQLADAERIGTFEGSGDQQNFFRQAGGPGWALVGDAGHHLDSITARGITNAFIQAELLDEAIGDRLQIPDALAAAVAEFARQRDDALTDIYEGTLETARLRISPSRIGMLRAISRSPELTGRYFAVVAGLLTIEDLLTPELADLI